MSPFPYITPGKGFNSTENPKNRSGDGPDNRVFRNGLIEANEHLLLEEQDKYRALESELAAKVAEIKELKVQLEKTQMILNSTNKNFECLRSSYVSATCDKDTAVRELEMLKNTDVHRKLKIEQDKVFCLERDLKLTNEKLKFECKLIFYTFNFL